MQSFYLTDPGKVRDHNEDSVVIIENQNHEYLLAVADGMGGHRGGEIASSIAITHIGKSFRNLGAIGTKEDAINWIKDSVSEANVLIYKYTAEHEESIGMGTTIVLALLTKDFLLFENAIEKYSFFDDLNLCISSDDTRTAIFNCRYFKNGKVHKITTDHTLVNLLVKSGELTLEEAQNHPRKNVLMKALGAANTVEMDIFDVETDVDGIFLCSDGLTNMLEEEQINKVLNEESTVEEKVNKLIFKSNNRGGTDNISIAYLVKDVAK